MAPAHPIDLSVRERLKRANLDQTFVAKAIGRKQSWLNKFIHGGGHATVDDVVRITALLIGEAGGLSETERRLLKACRTLPAELQPDAAEFFENHARFLRRGRGRRSAAPAAETPSATTSKARGKR